MKTPTRLLVAVDSSKYSFEVLDAVAVRGWEPGAQIRILSVVKPSADSESTQQYVRQCEFILDDRVQRLAKSLPECNVSGECAEGDPATTIVETAERWCADLLIIGSHGDTGPRPKGVGSVAAAVVNQAPCSIAIVKVKVQSSKSASQSKKSALALQ
jgi:nucleotide-binding universal stress UspA family protein